MRHRPGELFVKFGNESRGVPLPLPPPFARLAAPTPGIPIPMPLLANPLPLLGLVPPCQPELRPAPRPYPKGAESLRALDMRLDVVPEVVESSVPTVPLDKFSLDVRCLLVLPRPSPTSLLSNKSIDTEPGLDGSGVEEALEPGYTICWKLC